MSAAFAVSLFPYYNNVFFLPSFCPFCFQQIFPFALFVSGEFLSRPFFPCSIFSLPKNFLLLFYCLLPNFFPKLLPASPVGLEPTCPPCFTEPLPSFLRFACVVRFLQRPSCPKFRLRGLYNLCPLPASPVGLEPICLPRLQSLCRLSYVSLVSFVFRKDLPVRNSVSEVFAILIPFLHHHQPEN